MSKGIEAKHSGPFQDFETLRRCRLVSAEAVREEPGRRGLVWKLGFGFPISSLASSL